MDRIIAVDFGDARTGLAVSDMLGMLANGIGYVKSDYMPKTADLVAEKVREYKAAKIVIGLPVNMNGTEGPRAEKCRAFAELLKERTDLPVRMWDERSTTVTAHNILNETNVRGKARKE